MVTKATVDAAVTQAQGWTSRRAAGSGATPAMLRSVADDFMFDLSNAQAVDGHVDAPLRCAGRLSVTVPKDVLDKAERVVALQDRGKLQDHAKAAGVDLTATTLAADVEYSLVPGEGDDPPQAKLEGDAGFAGFVGGLLTAAVLEPYMQAEYDAVKQEEQARAEARAMANDPSRAAELAGLRARKRHTHAADDDESAGFRADKAAVAAERAAAEAAARGQ
jgi:hypothetical protein